MACCVADHLPDPNTCFLFEQRRVQVFRLRRSFATYRPGRSPDWIQLKNPDAPAAIRVCWSGKYSKQQTDDGSGSAGGMPPTGAEVHRRVDRGAGSDSKGRLAGLGRAVGQFSRAASRSRAMSRIMKPRLPPGPLKKRRNKNLLSKTN